MVVCGVSLPKVSGQAMPSECGSTNRLKFQCNDSLAVPLKGSTSTSKRFWGLVKRRLRKLGFENSGNAGQALPRAIQVIEMKARRMCGFCPGEGFLRTGIEYGRDGDGGTRSGIDDLRGPIPILLQPDGWCC